MSYILEALKKSAQERRQGSSPRLADLPLEPPAFAGRRPANRFDVRLLAGLLLLLSVVLLLATFRLWPTDEEKDTVPVATDAPRAPAGQTEIASPPATAPATADATAADAGDAAGAMATELTEQGEFRELRELRERRELSEPAAKGEQAAEQGEMPATAAVRKITGPAKKRLSPPPPLAELRFAGHTYALEPARRLIIVNNRIIREGEWIGEELRLQEITWEGVVVDYQGTLYPLPSR